MFFCKSSFNMRHTMWVTVTVMLIVLQLCNAKPEEGDCTVEHQSEIFDFSGLSLLPWKVIDINGTPLMYASISLCNRTHQTPCGMASVCVVEKNNSTWSSLESIVHVEGEGDSRNIKATSVLKKMYTANVVTAEIKLICVDKIGGPAFVKFANNHIYFLWETVAACTVKYPSSYKNCLFHDEQKGKINLQPLRKLQYYTATDTKGHIYYINICGGVVNGSVCGNVDDVAVCEIDSENKTHVLGNASKQQIVKKGGLALEFRSKKNIVKVELVCNSSVLHGQLKFKSETHTTHIFELETSRACILELMDCSVRDASNYKYDLSHLRNMGDVVVNKGNIKFVLSVCRSVKHSLCSGGSSVCLVNGSSSVSLGTLGDGPEKDDELSISSSDGAYCNVSNFRYRAVIVFKCSKVDKRPDLVSVPSECVYVFNWYTTAACPLVSSVGIDCRVHDPVYGYDFNFKSLHKVGDYIIINENAKFDLNVCEKLSKSCNGSRDVGVCLTDQQGNQYPIGNPAISPHYDDGRLSFVLHGNGCKSGQMSSTVHITFLCSHDATEDKSHPQYFSQDDNCTYYFFWPTVLACANFVAHECEVSDDRGKKYDLKSLSLPNEDYIILTNGTNGYRKFIINVCRPVIFGHESRCPSQSGVCLQDMTEPNYQKSFTSLGEASGLQYDRENKVLKLEYTGGAICHSVAETETHCVITFVCDKKRNESSRPTLLKEDGCLYEFEWKTYLACSEEVVEEDEEQKDDYVDTGCRLLDPNSGIVLDFTLLAGREQIMKNSNGDVFRLVVCGSLNKLSTEGVGICHETGGGEGCENIGLENRKLQYKIGRLYLNYTNGVLCSPNARKYTIIEFVCEMKDEKLEITFSNPCEYNVIWRTNLACVVPCITDESRKINLFILSSNENNYNTSVNGIDYFISVCRPLVPKEGLNCFHGTAVCKAVHHSESTWSDEVALGFSHYRPVFLGNSVVLNYSSNVPCSNNVSQNLGPSIIFICDPRAGLGTPVLNHIYFNCQYEFLWKTNVVCEDYSIQFSGTHSDRILNNRQSKTFINLQSLCRRTKYKVENYFISMCNSSFLCEVEKVENQKQISYGKGEYAIFSYSENVTKLFLSGGDQCETRSSEKNNAVIILTCSTSPENHLHILRQSDCSVEFEWKTSAACSQLMTSTDTNVTTSMDRASTIGVVLGICLTVIMCLIVYFLHKSSSRNWCRTKINRIFRRRHQGEFHYTLRNPDSFDFELSSAESL